MIGGRSASRIFRRPKGIPLIAQWTNPSLLRVGRAPNEQHCTKEAAVHFPKFSSNTWYFLYFAGSVITLSLFLASDVRHRADPTNFSSFKLIAKEPISSTCAILTFKSRRQRAEYQAEEVCVLRSLEIKQPLLQITRPYTPLPYTKAEWEAGIIRFLIKREPVGEVSRYLHDLPVDQPGKVSGVEIRGPYLEYVLPQDIGEVLFIAGGTGIAPALQLASFVAHQKIQKLNVNILWANRKREDCIDSTTQSKGIILQELDRLQQINASDAESRIDYDYFVDEDGSYISQNVLQKCFKSRHFSSKGKACKKVIIICGTDGFVEHFAGSKRIQGQIAQPEKLQGGVLARLKVDDWDVVRL